MLNSIPSKLMSTQNHRLWPDLETAALQIWLVKTRSHWSKVSPKFTMTGVLIRRDTETGETQRQGRGSCDDGGRDWSEASTSQRTPKIAGNTRSWREAWNRFALRVLIRNQPCWHLDSRLPASRTVREDVSVALCPSVCGKVTAALGNE